MYRVGEYILELGQPPPRSGIAAHVAGVVAAGGVGFVDLSALRGCGVMCEERICIRDDRVRHYTMLIIIMCKRVKTKKKGIFFFSCRKNRKRDVSLSASSATLCVYSIPPLVYLLSASLTSSNLTSSTSFISEFFTSS
jgi:hypothetical protein